MPAAREYLDAQGKSPFAVWFGGLDAPAAAKVSTAIIRLEGGNTSNLKPVGEGVSELVVDWGPGYRVYAGQDGAELVILLGGSSKKRQQKAIDDAKARWADYRQRKKKGEL